MKKRKLKKSVKILIIVLVILGAIVGGLVYASKKAVAALQEQIGNSLIEEVTERSLIKSVGATGKVVSVQSKDITATLAGTKIKAVQVKVGDTIEEGQELVIFDMSDVEENLANAKNSLAKAKQRNELSQNDAARNLSDLERTKNYQIDNAKSNVESLNTNYQKTVNSYNEAVAKLEDLKNKEAGKENNYTEAKNKTATEKKNFDNATSTANIAAAEYAVAKNAYDTAKASFEQKKLIYLGNYAGASFPSDSEPSDSIQLAAYQELVGENTALGSLLATYNQKNTANAAAQTAASVAQMNYNSAKTDEATKEAEYNQAKATREAQESTVKGLAEQVENALASYQSGVKSYENTVASQESAIESAKSSQKSAALAWNTDTEEKQMKTLEEQLEQGILCAPFAGIVTAVNYSAGDTYAQGPILTIQDCSAYEIEAEIGEYDISDIVLGQKVLIKTKATGDEELEGTVIFVSPTASPSATGDVNYKIKISIDTPNERLRLDMSASLSILIEQHENVLTVPYNAVWEEADGTKYIKAVEEDGVTTTDIPVKVILDSNYYTQIEAPELYAGMKIMVQDSEYSNFFQALEMGEF